VEGQRTSEQTRHRTDKGNPRPTKDTAEENIVASLKLNESARNPGSFRSAEQEIFSGRRCSGWGIDDQRLEKSAAGGKNRNGPRKRGESFLRDVGEKSATTILKTKKKNKSKRRAGKKLTLEESLRLKADCRKKRFRMGVRPVQKGLVKCRVKEAGNQATMNDERSDEAHGGEILDPLCDGGRGFKTQIFVLLQWEGGSSGEGSLFRGR